MKKRLILISIIVGVVLTILIVIRLISNGLNESYQSFRPNTSIQSSKTAGQFVAELSPTPVSVEKYGVNITIKSAWIENQAEIKYRYLFQEQKIIHPKKKSLCVIMESSRKESELIIRCNDVPGAGILHNKSGIDLLSWGISSDLTDTFRLEISKNIKDSGKHDILLIRN